MEDEEIFRRVQAKKGRGVGVSLSQEHVRTPREEMRALLTIIDKECARIAYPEGVLKADEPAFIASMHNQINSSQTWEPKPNMIFWLRDIKDRLVEA